MGRIKTSPKNRVPTAIALVVAALACLGAGGCGNSSANTTPTSTSSRHEAPSIKTRGQYLAVLECVRHNGIKLPPLNKLGTYKPKNPRQLSAVSKICIHTVLYGRGNGSSGSESSGGASG
jgi:hypothetical protein